MSGVTTDDPWERIDDPRGLLRAASASAPVELDLGCGTLREHPGAIGIDLLPDPAVDVVADAFDVVAALPDASVRTVYSRHFFEHLDNPVDLIRGLGRIVRPTGTMHVIVPHFSNPYYYSDPTHKSPFGLYTFSYLSADRRFRRKVPNYFGTFDFDLTDVRMIFKAKRPYYLSYAANKAIQRLVNARPGNQETFEYRWSSLWPCYELEFTLTRRLSLAP